MRSVEEASNAMALDGIIFEVFWTSDYHFLSFLGVVYFHFLVFDWCMHWLLVIGASGFSDFTFLTLVILFTEDWGEMVCHCNFIYEENKELVYPYCKRYQHFPTTWCGTWVGNPRCTLTSCIYNFLKLCEMCTSDHV